MLDPPRIVDNSYVRLDITMKFLAWWLSMGANLRVKMSMEIETRGLEWGVVGPERKRRKIVDILIVIGCYMRITTGFSRFAECRLHSAKDSLHSANSLPSVTLGKHHSAKPPTAQWSLPSVGFRALGIGATWRDPGRHLCRVPNGRHSAKWVVLPSAGCGTRQTFKSLPSG